MNTKRKVLFRDDDDFMLIITDAPHKAINDWCVRYVDAIQNGTYGKELKLFDTLKATFYVKVLLDSVIDSDPEDINIIGFDAIYDLRDYSILKRKVEGYQTIKLTAGMTSEFEIIRTNAPYPLIKAQLTYTSALQEECKSENPYCIIESMGYKVEVLGGHDDFSSTELESVTFDAEFDYYDY